jgi:hypothetical protein
MMMLLSIYSISMCVLEREREVTNSFFVTQLTNISRDEEDD